jgi:transposase
MPTLLKLRALTPEEETALQRLAHARTAPVRTVERARIVWLAHQGQGVGAIATEVGVCAATVRHWLKRFTAAGVEGLADAPRPGHAPTYTPEQVGEVIALSLTDPQTLKLPFASWTLDRLEAYLNEERAIPIKRSRISELLIAEGLRWRTQERWFGERPDPEFGTHRLDPEFGQKRGPLSRSTRRHLTAV